MRSASCGSGDRQRGARATPWNMVFAPAVATVAPGARPSRRRPRRRDGPASPRPRSQRGRHRLRDEGGQATGTARQTGVERGGRVHVLPSKVHFWMPPPGGDRSSARYRSVRPRHVGVAVEEGEGIGTRAGGGGHPSDVATGPLVVGRPLPTANTFTNVPELPTHRAGRRRARRRACCLAAQYLDAARRAERDVEDAGGEPSRPCPRARTRCRRPRRRRARVAAEAGVERVVVSTLPAASMRATTRLVLALAEFTTPMVPGAAS